jgi:RNA polymerase sigma-70 factor (ECF subfamily)
MDLGLNSITDNALMQKVKSGDVEKLGLLYERYNEALFAFFYRNTGEKENSEDLVHTVFLRLLKYRNRFRNEGKFTSWMYFIAHNVVCDHYKKDKHSEYYDGQLADTIAADGLSDDEMLKRENLELLKSAMSRLNPEEREILIFSKYHNLKYKEIAGIFNCSEGAVKVRIFRALKQLREIYLSLEK